MSLTTLLLAFLPAVVQARREPEKSKREKALEAERDALQAELERAWAEVASWRRRFDESQEMLERLARDRIDRRLHEPPFPTPLQQQLAQYQQGLANAQANAQYQAQQAMNAQNYGLLGAQNLAFHDCNCVPARHDMLLGIAG